MRLEPNDIVKQLEKMIKIEAERKAEQTKSVAPKSKLTWKVVRALYPNAPWWKIPYLWWKLRKHNLTPNSFPMGLEALRNGIIGGQFGTRGYTPPEYDNRGKVINNEHNQSPATGQKVD
jgi:hypothetical protein